MSDTTIEEAIQAFDLWRSKRQGKSKTPDHLKTMAISLLGKHSISDVCKQLGLNNSTLRNWGGLKKPKLASSLANDFITLDPNQHISKSGHDEISLHLTTFNGIDCKLSGLLEAGFIASLLDHLQGRGI